MLSSSNWHQFQSIFDLMDENRIPRIEIAASRKPSIIQYFINMKLKSLIDSRKSLFESVYPVSDSHAVKLLVSGYKHISSFGYWDAVEVSYQIQSEIFSFLSLIFRLIKETQQFHLSEIRLILLILSFTINTFTFFHHLLTELLLFKTHLNLSRIRTS